MGGYRSLWRGGHPNGGSDHPLVHVPSWHEICTPGCVRACGVGTIFHAAIFGAENFRRPLGPDTKIDIVSLSLVFDAVQMPLGSCSSVQGTLRRYYCRV